MVVVCLFGVTIGLLVWVMPFQLLGFVADEEFSELSAAVEVQLVLFQISLLFAITFFF